MSDTIDVLADEPYFDQLIWTEYDILYDLVTKYVNRGNNIST